jgi:iron complex outermembrane receptor protein
VHNSYTFLSATFRDYVTDTTDYSNNNVTGIPQHVVISDITLLFPAGIYFFAEYNYTAKLPLNDANTVYANDYHLVRLKAGWKREDRPHHLTYELYAGIDNLLNQRYSLGNDLNAAGGRYFNAAAPVNFYVGVVVGFRK